eukprot:7911557-Alexandrium_andersonii.AAC.1
MEHNGWQLTDAVKDLLWGLFATRGNTKHTLEDVFNTLRDLQRDNKNKRIALHRLFWTAWNSKFLATDTNNADGFQHLALCEADMDTDVPEAPVNLISDAAFHANKHKVAGTIPVGNIEKGGGAA